MNECQFTFGSQGRLVHCHNAVREGVTYCPRHAMLIPHLEAEKLAKERKALADRQAKLRKKARLR
jgi:hypothetical protein